MNHSHYANDNIRTRRVRAAAESRNARIDRAIETREALETAAVRYAGEATPARAQALNDAARRFAPYKGWAEASKVNQCDGCKRGLALDSDGFHIDPASALGLSGCDADLYN